MAAVKRPGGEIANRPLHFIWIVDCSGSMDGDKIGTVNHAIQEIIPEMRKEAEGNPNAQVLMRALKFSGGASWITSAPEKLDNFTWTDLEADEVTNMGEAFKLLAAQLTIPPMPERALPPVLVLLSDGAPTDNYQEPLQRLLDLPWGKKAVKIAISIGKDADDDMLYEFTGNREYVLQASNVGQLKAMIKWASTVVNIVSAPKTGQDSGTGGQLGLGPAPVLPDTGGDVW